MKGLLAAVEAGRPCSISLVAPRGKGEAVCLARSSGRLDDRCGETRVNEADDARSSGDLEDG